MPVTLGSQPQELESDHVAANTAHAEVDALCRQWLTSGPLHNEQTQRLARVLHDLRVMYRHHIEVEERQIFPLAAQVLNPQQLAQMGRQMAQRRALMHT
jgi:hemerythrin-like domain-containing protein